MDNFLNCFYYYKQKLSTRHFLCSQQCYHVSAIGTPSRKSLVCTLLNNFIAEVKQSTKDNLNGKTIVLIENKWSNIHNDPITTTCIHFEDNSYFLEAIGYVVVTKRKKRAKYHKENTENSVQKE